MCTHNTDSHFICVITCIHSYPCIFEVCRLTICANMHIRSVQLQHMCKYIHPPHPSPLSFPQILGTTRIPSNHPVYPIHRIRTCVHICMQRQADRGTYMHISNEMDAYACTDKHSYSTLTDILKLTRTDIPIAHTNRHFYNLWPHGSHCIAYRDRHS